MNTVASSGRTVLYASVGAELNWFALDPTDATLAREGAVSLPGAVQYVWPHPSRRYLYVASSNGGPAAVGGAGNTHTLTAFAIATSGALAPLGPSRELLSRPIHCTVDHGGRFILTAYPKPSAITVHRIEPDGSLGTEVAQSEPRDAGIYAHQVRVTPSNNSVILVTRGNHALPDRKEERGALKVFRFEDGQLRDERSVSLERSDGFQPRHVDFHPTRPFMYVALEAQNELLVFDFDSDENLSTTPRFSCSTLSGTVGNGIGASAIHFHPNGHSIYVANRDGTDGGEDNIAVFAVDPATGEPHVIQHADPRAVHVRTFAIDPTGRLLVAASIRQAGAVPAGLSVFQIGADGSLTFLRKCDIDTAQGALWWSGIVSAPLQEQ
jgi:6-phosphogluconolactonase (cycloisomerase 2 family)